MRTEMSKAEAITRIDRFLAYLEKIYTPQCDCEEALIRKDDITAFVIARDALKKERPHGEWIPCSERLPKEHHTYLVTRLDPNPSESTFTTLSYFFTKETGWDIYGVIAWMPYPEPYKKEGGTNG